MFDYRKASGSCEERITLRLKKIDSFNFTTGIATTGGLMGNIIIINHDNWNCYYYELSFTTNLVSTFDHMD